MKTNRLVSAVTGASTYSPLFWDVCRDRAEDSSTKVASEAQVCLVLSLSKTAGDIIYGGRCAVRPRVVCPYCGNSRQGLPCEVNVACTATQVLQSQLSHMHKSGKLPLPIVLGVKKGREGSLGKGTHIAASEAQGNPAGGTSR
jgi:hypothetical protein